MSHVTRSTNMELCPTRDELASIIEAAGDTGEVAGDIAEHVERCVACQQTIEQLAEAEDTLNGLRWPTGVTQWDEVASRLVASVTEQLLRRSDIPPAGAIESDLPTIPGYRVIGLLGSGGMGTVYEAIHLCLRRPVAIKVVAETFCRDPKWVARFKKEMVAIGQLNHPGIVRAYDAAECEGLHYLVMEKISGRTVAEIAREAQCMNVADSCKIVRQIAIALRHAHDQGLVHGDIKPSNVMINDAGTVKILDWGLARLGTLATKQQRSIASPGKIAGTIDYLSPEQAAESNAIDIRSDLYSLGTMFHKLLTGTVPFASPQYGTVAAKLIARTTTPAPSVSTHRADLPSRVIVACDRLLMIDPEKRFANPIDLANVLEPFCRAADLVGLVRDPARVAARKGRPIAVMPKFAFSRSSTIVASFAAIGLLGLWFAWSAGFFAMKSAPDMRSNVLAPVAMIDPAKNTALSFENMSDEVLIPTLYDQSDSLTIEIRLKRVGPRIDAHSDIVGFDPMMRLGTGSTHDLIFITPTGEASAHVEAAGKQQPYRKSGVAKPIHLAGVRDAVNQQIRLYIDGELVSTTDFQGDVRRGNGSLQICGSERQWQEPSGHDNSYAGWVDELRLSDFARYDDSFEPQVRLEPDDHTLALYHFDEGQGDVLVDSSGNDHHGKIVGAKWVDVDVQLSDDETEVEIIDWILQSGGEVEIANKLISVGGLPEVVDWSRCTVRLIGNRFDDESLKKVAQLPHLKRLVIASPSVTERGLASLEGIGLQFLLFERQYPFRLQQIVRLQSLQELALVGKHISRAELERLSALDNLRSLTLNGARLDDGQLDAFEALPWLTEIALVHNNLSAETFAAMPDLPELQIMAISMNPIGDEAIERLLKAKTLRHLSLDRTQISDVGMLKLAALPALEYLSVGGTNVTAAGVAAFKQALPKDRAFWFASEFPDMSAPPQVPFP